MQLPNGFTVIKDATIVGDVVNLMGVLVSYNGPRPSKGTDHVLDFTIQDDFTSGSVGGQSSISGRIFKPFYKFPKISGPGDVIIVRKVKLNQWMTRMECLGDRYETTITVFPSRMIPVPELSHAYQAGSQKLPCDSTPMTQTPTVAEQMAVIRLKHASSGSNQLVQQHAATAAATSRTTRRETLIKDLQFDVFANVRAQVVNVYHYPMGGQVDLKVTDYTPNENMFFYADPEIEEGLVSDRSWKGPYGYLTLSVTLYEENANWARENVATGDYVYIRNMRPKMSTRNTLEGVVHQDKVNASQVDIRHLKNESDIAEINKRREEYERKRGGKTAFARLENEPKRPSAKAAHNKRLAKRERQRAEKEAEIEELQKKAEAWEAERTGINPNVRSAHGDMRLCGVWEIKNNRHLTMRTPIQYNEYVLPFVNCRYRTRVRVVDVFPPKLELFAHSLNDPNWSKHPKKRTFDSTSSKERWEWGFVLLLEDVNVAPGRVPEKIRVLVNNSSAQYLLKMGAQDLKKNPKALKQLERKLFILWGNLMELKTELRAQGSDLPLPPGDNRLQNKPFEACIEEYGCEVPVTFFDMFGYRRMHKLALTTINMD